MGQHHQHPLLLNPCHEAHNPPIADRQAHKLLQRHLHNVLLVESQRLRRPHLKNQRLATHPQHHQHPHPRHPRRLPTGHPQTPGPQQQTNPRRRRPVQLQAQHLPLHHSRRGLLRPDHHLLRRSQAWLHVRYVYHGVEYTAV